MTWQPHPNLEDRAITEGFTDDYALVQGAKLQRQNASR